MQWSINNVTLSWQDGERSADVPLKVRFRFAVTKLIMRAE